MHCHLNAKTLSAIVLTLLLSLSFGGCSQIDYMRHRNTPPCITHAYLQMGVEDYITRRYHRGSPVRIGIVPFSVPANLASQSAEQPGMGNKLAWRVHALLLREASLPIVEVFNRQDWPGKKEEFFTGNFGAIAVGRQAGYDLLLLGSLANPNSPSSLVAHTKLIDVESGITVWYGESKITLPQSRPSLRPNWWSTGNYRPDQRVTNIPLEGLAECIAEGLLAEEELGL